MFRVQLKLSLIDNNVIWLLSLVYLLMRIKANFLRYTGYKHFIRDPISHASSCTTTELSIILTSCLTAIKNHVIKYCESVFERNGENLFWSIKNSCEILKNEKSKGFLASSVSTYDFFTPYLITSLSYQRQTNCNY